MRIGSLQVGADSPPIVIAEMSGNHNGSLDTALAMVDAIARSGAHAMKLQTYTADTMTLDVDANGFRIADENSLWNDTSLYELYQKAHTPWEWHEPIFERARRHGMEIFSTPFDATAVEFLESLHVPAYKIASFEVTDLGLISVAASTGKPLIISTGMASHEEISEAMDAARKAGCTEIALLKCTSSYPASPASSNLRTIPYMREAFGCEVGLSDHTLGIGAAIASVAVGATLIEKHVTLNRADGGVDSAFSLEPPELSRLVAEMQTAWTALGEVRVGPTESEQGSLGFRRSLYICQDLSEGDVLTPENLRAIRPGYGLPPKHLEELMGRRVTRRVARGTPMSWDLLK